MTRFEIEMNAAMNHIHRAQKTLSELRSAEDDIERICRELAKHITELETHLESMNDPHVMFPGAG